MAKNMTVGLGTARILSGTLKINHADSARYAIHLSQSPFANYEINGENTGRKWHRLVRCRVYQCPASGCLIVEAVSKSEPLFTFVPSLRLNASRLPRG
jgi:hypothetical protein